MKSRIKGNLYALLIGGVLSFLCCEVFLRFNTHNIYANMSVINDERTQGIRLRWPMENNTIRIDGLYENAELINIRVDNTRNIYPGYDNKGENLIFFLGGSTTACTMIPEGARFPDLIGKALGYYPMNYGVSGNNSFESYLNLKYLLEEYELKPKIVFLMHGGNDYGLFIKSGGMPDAISNIDVLLDVRNGSQNYLFIRDKINSYLRKSYVIAHSYLAIDAIFGENYLENQINDAKSQSLNFASLADFESLTQSTQFQLFLKNRKETYGKFISLAQKHGARVVILTQPSSFSDKYKPYTNIDLRTYPKTLDRKRMNIVQSKLLLNILNQNNREVAAENNALLIDLEKYFSQRDPSPYFYDSVHYTKKGAALIADIVVQEINTN